MILESEVREKLAAVARQALSLEDFADWIDEHGWNMHSDSSPGAVDLVSSIHLLLSERDDRFIDDLALRDGLISLLNNVRESLVIGNAANAVAAPKLSASKVYWVPTQRWVLLASA